MDAQLEMEKRLMTKEELLQQNRFEQLINIMIMYKQQNLKEDVYLTEKNVTKAIKWYQTNFASILSQAVKGRLKLNIPILSISSRPNF